MPFRSLTTVVVKSMACLPVSLAGTPSLIPVILDGGIRRGIDIIRAIAMGTDAVAVGRPMLYGLGLGGAQGVESVINFLNNDLKSTMLLTGAAKLSDLNPDYIEIVGQNEEYSTFQG